MSSHNGAKMSSFKAEGDLSSKQFHGVKFGSSDSQVVAAAANEGFGILMNAPTDGKGAEVALPGGSGKAKLGGTVVRGQSLAPDAAGAFIATITAGLRCTCIAMESGVAGDVIPVEIQIHTV